MQWLVNLTDKLYTLIIFSMINIFIVDSDRIIKLYSA